jgi:hypothetical protein
MSLEPPVEESDEVPSTTSLIWSRMEGDEVSAPANKSDVEVG